MSVEPEEPSATHDLSNQAICSQQRSCLNCSNVAMCHWCSYDMKCHTYGSPYGCAVGLSCDDRALCFRTVPEYIGTATAPSAIIPTVMATVLVMLVFLACCAACWITKNRKRKWQQIKETNENLSGYDRLLVEDSVLLRHYQADHEFVKQNSGRDSSDSSDSLHNREVFVFDEVTPINLQQRSCCRLRCWKKLPNCCCSRKFWFSVVFLIVLIFLATVTILFWPQLPLHSSCNTRLEWSSILQTLKKTQPSGEMEMHFAVYNPSRYDLQVSSIDVFVSYHNSTIGEGTFLSQTKFRSGAITDVIAQVTFSMPSALALSLWEEHRQNKLTFNFSLSITADLWYNRQHLLFINTTWAPTEINVLKPSTREYCKC